MFGHGLVNRLRNIISPVPPTACRVLHAQNRAGCPRGKGVAMASVRTAANRILELSKTKGIDLTPLQLMKLVYMSNGWMLGLHGLKLFDDKIEAWKYGPVIPTLYHETKEFGASPIRETLPEPVGDKLDPRAVEILASVVDSYGHLSGAALSNLTHKPGSPWAKVWDPDRSHIEIPESVIREHYERLKDADVVTAA